MTRTLSEWLLWQQQLHSREIELGLTRVRRVAERLGLLSPVCCVITVAGTNGKGSSVAMLETILCAAGYRVGSYTSPHLLRYNERIRLNAEPVEDASICAAFELIDGARENESLTYFEFGTLAALAIFAEIDLDVLLLEVGLGGRLDAVNIIDADAALITSIGLDHQEWLGTSVEAIAAEKAGIMRPSRPVIINTHAGVDKLVDCAKDIKASVQLLGEDYCYQEHANVWCWTKDGDQVEYPRPVLAGAHQVHNAAGVIAVLNALSGRLQVPHDAICVGLQSVVLAGRFQQIGDQPRRFVDVSHNVEAAHALVENIQSLHRNHGATLRMVIGMLSDKDFVGVAGVLQPIVDRWYCAPVASERSAEIAAMMGTLTAECNFHGDEYESITAAWKAAQNDAGPDDIVVATGSFYVVSEILACQATPNSFESRAHG